MDRHAQLSYGQYWERQMNLSSKRQAQTYRNILISKVKLSHMDDHLDVVSTNCSPFKPWILLPLYSIDILLWFNVLFSSLYGDGIGRQIGFKETH